MATNLRVNFIGKNELSKTTAVASRDLKKLGKTATSVGKGINKAFGGLGVGLGFAALANGLKNATKAASEDRKAQGLLANALRQTVGATESAIAGAEQYIKKTQSQTAVLDDELRPALTSAVRATGSLAGGQRLLDIALDISAETGKDLGSVTGSLSKAYGGNLGALKRLVPGIQLTADWMGQLETLYGGTAEKAANLDPYQRLEVAFAEIQETIGEALLPSLEAFTAYLESPAGTENVKDIVDGFVLMGKAISEVIKFLVDNANLVKALITAVVFLKVSWHASYLAVKVYTAMTGNAVKATKLLRTALITTGVGAALVLLGTLAEGWINAGEARDEYFEDPTAASGDFTIVEWAKKNKDKLIPDWSDEWLQLGYESYGAYLQGMYIADQKATSKKNKIKNQAKEFAKEVRSALDAKLTGIKKSAENFRDSIAIAFGVFGEDENSVFNAEYFVAKLKSMLAAAKGFASNLAKINAVDPSGSIANELIAMGPAQGNIAAKGLLASGQLKEIVGLRTELYGAGAQAGAVSAVAGNATYEININKAVISAVDIIKEIRMLEKKTGRKYLVN
jgi:hypothetical protein